MPYTKIIWIKLFLSLLTEDDRFLYQLNERQQLLYIKLLLLAGMTNNKITKNTHFICHKLNYNHEEACFIADIKRIKEVFPRFKEDEFYYFENFENIHNQVRDSQRIAKGYPKTEKGLDQIKNKNKIKKEDSSASHLPLKAQLSDNDFISSLKTNKAFSHINIEHELLKMDAWVSTHKGRQKTRRFIVNWLNKTEAPVNTTPKVKYIPTKPKNESLATPEEIKENIKKMKELVRGIG